MFTFQIHPGRKKNTIFKLLFLIIFNVLQFVKMFVEIEISSSADFNNENETNETCLWLKTS